MKDLHKSGKPSKGRNTRNTKTNTKVAGNGQDNSKVSGHFGEGQPKCNDISWYSKNQVLLESAANISFLSATGTVIPWADPTAGDTLSVADRCVSTPGVLAVHYVPGPGIALDGTAPVNIAAHNIYTFIRNTNSGGKNYDAPDMMMYLLALDSIYAQWNHLQRAYGVAQTYSALNRYLPQGLLKAMGFDPDSFFFDMANIRTRLNILAGKISSFAVPSTMPYFLRHSWMNSNVYRDADNDKAGLYVFVPDVYYQFEETAETTGGSLVAMEYAEDISEAITQLNTAVDKLLYSYDIGTMSGDIMKAYGPSGLYSITPIAPDYKVESVYNPEVLMQIHNSNCAPKGSLDSLKILQDPDTNNIVWHPQYSNDKHYSTWFRLPINMPMLNPTPADVMLATRLTCAFDTQSNYVVACGSEYVTSYVITYFRKYGGSIAIQTSEFNSQLGTKWSTESTKNVLDHTTLASQFDWHPILRYITYDTEAQTAKLDAIVGDLNVFALADAEFLDNLNEVAMLSLFNVPQVR